MRARAYYRATKGDRVIEGAKEEVARRINARAKWISNAKSRKSKVNGYEIERIGTLLEKYNLYQNGKLIDCDTLPNLAKSHYFSESTMRVSLLYRQGECYDNYQIKHTGVYKVVEENKNDCKRIFTTNQEIRSTNKKQEARKGSGLE